MTRRRTQLRSRGLIAAYVAHVLAHHDSPRELLTRSILLTAFALWSLVQIAPTAKAGLKNHRCRDPNPRRR